MILDWNPDRVLVSLGPVSIYWYGLLFVAGFLLGYWIMTWICKRENYPTGELDSLLIYLFIGTIVGARLGHVFFYEPQYFLAQPIEILKIWKGGLASHGGAIGLLLSFAFFIYMHTRNNVLWLMDRLCIPTALTAVFIRCGNFMNSEIVGIPTGSDYGVIFRQAHEFNSVPCHPVQLYEAAAYLVVFLILFAGYLFNRNKKAGRPLGIFLTLVFTARMILEVFKQSQTTLDNAINGIISSFVAFPFQVSMGMLLSIPFVIVGIVMIVIAKNEKVPPLSDEDLRAFGMEPARAKEENGAAGNDSGKAGDSGADDSDIISPDTITLDTKKSGASVSGDGMIHDGKVVQDPRDLDPDRFNG